ncbi:hypothetical protein AVEN_200027-1 [Araneus ventricosus]|uniref:SWIM-type domain-containing protein n=1 Tax=Araneus ventricosus TaxID=182803 RepID=A0A4Y2TGP2_ARAVE|nr:hypothetical protein AVEN_200027-1 [Araneus ventricosus]
MVFTDGSNFGRMTELSIRGLRIWLRHHIAVIGYENTKYHPLKESTRDLIKSYLLLSFPVSKIVSLLRDDVGSRDKINFHPTKEAFISGKTIRAYLRHLRNTMQPASDAVSVLCIVENLKNEPYNPILIFKLQESKTVWGPSDLDSLPNWESSFILGFQIKEQGDMLMKHSHKVLCIDSTHAHSKLTKTVKEKHDWGVMIQDMDVVEYDGHWTVKFQSVKGKVYMVRQIADTCGLMGHCYFKRANINCAALCSHLYDCSCEDNSNLCKHIHKVHILCSEIKTRVTDDFIEINSEENSSAISSEILNVDILSNTESCRSKVTECKMLCSEILEFIESTLVASMRGVLNLKNNFVSIAPQLYAAPTQKIIPHVKFYRTSQRKKGKGLLPKK